MRIYDQLRRAVADKRAIRCVFKGRLCDVCPHVVGHKNGQEMVLAFQYAGYSSTGLLPAGEWICMLVSDISEVVDMGGTWRTGTSRSRPQTCIETIDLEVAS